MNTDEGTQISKNTPKNIPERPFVNLIFLNFENMPWFKKLF